LIELDLASECFEVDRLVAFDPKLAHPELRTLDNGDLEEEPVLIRLHLWLPHSRLHVALIGVLLLDETQVAAKHRLRIGPRLVEPARRKGIEAPDLGCKTLLEFIVAEDVVTRKFDLAKLELLLLLDLEVDRDRAFSDLLYLISDLGEVVAFAAVERRNALAILAQEREVQRRTGRQGEHVLDLVPVDFIVSNDRDLAYDGTLRNVEDHAHTERRLLDRDPDITEESLLEDRAHIPGNLRTVDRLGDGGPDSHANRIFLDSLVSTDHDFSNQIAGWGANSLAENPLGANDFVDNNNAILALNRARLDVRDPRVARQCAPIGIHLGWVEGCPLPKTETLAQLALDRTGALDPNLQNSVQRAAARRGHDSVGQLTEPFQQLAIAVGRHDQARTCCAAAGRRQAHVETEAPGELGQASGHNCIDAELVGNRTQSRIGSVSIGEIVAQDLHHFAASDDADLSADLDPLGDQLIQRACSEANRVGAIQAKRQHRNAHGGLGSSLGGPDLDRSRTLRDGLARLERLEQEKAPQHHHEHPEPEESQSPDHTPPPVARNQDCLRTELGAAHSTELDGAAPHQGFGIYPRLIESPRRRPCPGRRRPCGPPRRIR